ncbi:TPA: hypothetical protein ACXM9H_000994 [Burkholderia multivorans]|uniref:hypothetical protein n=1 Tax=Burkholderia multivorans TaxID=87883 RepID=UPI0011B214F2|nr:hypothetical protein [Burkholderia multivorans]
MTTNLSFHIERDGVYDVLTYKSGGCRPATPEEIELWDALVATTKDAERYRYLRSSPESVEPERIDVVYWKALDDSANEGDGLRGDALDTAIDAELLKEVSHAQ